MIVGPKKKKTSYLRRRDGIIEVLDGLKEHWDLAPGLSALMGSEYVTPELIDGIEKILRDAIKTAKNTDAREKIQAGLDRIEAMKKAEIEERISEQKNLDNTVLANSI